MNGLCSIPYDPPIDSPRSTSAGDIRIGPASSTPDDAGFARLLPLYTTPGPGFREPNEAAALYVHALFALRDRHLGFVEANFAPLVLSFFACIQNNRRALVEDVRRGTAAGALALGADPAIVAQLEAASRPDAARADEIAAALAGEDPDSRGAASEAAGPGRPAGQAPLARRLWPRLRVVLAVTTGAAAPYAERLRAEFLGAAGAAGAVPVYSPVYAASEGLLGVNLDPLGPDPAYALPPRAAFFEFIPAACAAADRPAALLPAELRAGEEYELVVTNLAGLWRYRRGVCACVRAWPLALQARPPAAVAPARLA